MATNITNVDFTNDLLPLIKEHGATWKRQTSFYKVSNKRKAVYISATKRGVTRIDVSGFELPDDMEGVRHLSADEAKALKLGKVRGQMMVKEDNIDRDLVIDNFDTILLALMADIEGDKQRGKAKPFDWTHYVASAAQAAASSDS